MPDDTANLNRAQAVAALPEMVALAEEIRARAKAVTSRATLRNSWKDEQTGEFYWSVPAHLIIDLSAKLEVAMRTLDALTPEPPNPDATQPSQPTAALTSAEAWRAGIAEQGNGYGE